MESLTRIRMTLKIPDEAPATMKNPPVNEASPVLPDNAVATVKTPESSPPATTSDRKGVTAGTKFSAETETLDAPQTVSEVIAKIGKISEQGAAKGERRWQMSELQECLSSWQDKVLSQYVEYKREIPTVVHHGDFQQESGPADLDSGRPSQKLDLKTFDGLSIGVEHLLGQSSHAVEAANQSDEASSAEPRESREEYNLAARSQNKGISSMDKELKPLRDSMNRDIPDFPINGLAIAKLSSQQCDELMKAWDLWSNASDVWTQQKICRYIGAWELSPQVLMLEDDDSARRHAIRW